MTGKKSFRKPLSSDAGTSKSSPQTIKPTSPSAAVSDGLDRNVIENVIGSVIKDTDILERSLAEKKHNDHVPRSKVAADDEAFVLLQQVKDDSEFIDLIATKISEIIMSNNIFKQIICDAVSLDLQEKMAKLKDEIWLQNEKIKTLEVGLENQAQYSRRNCLLIHGVVKKLNEDTDETAIQIFNDYLGVKVTKSCIDRSHRLRSANEKSPIIEKFLSYNLRNLVFLNKKKLKDSGIVITEALTPQRRACVKRLTELRKKGLIHSNWTVDGKIFYTKPNNTSTKLMIDPPNLDNIDLKFAKQN